MASDEQKTIDENQTPYCEIAPEKFNIEPFTLVIFGGTGDLSRRKLLPTLFHLCHDQNLSEDFSIIGIGSTDRSDDDYRIFVKQSIEEYSEEIIHWPCWERFSSKLFYVSGRFDDNNTYKKLFNRLTELAKPDSRGIKEVIYYMAVPPQFLSDIISGLSLCNLCKGTFSTRLVVEKPFGRDKKSASELNNLIAAAFDENQIYRIDHYLGKETVQNILFFRFANSIFEPLWNRRYIDHVQLTVAESIGIEHRAQFYEDAGVIRDIVQNHMMQLLSLVAMEPPIGFEADYIRDEKVKVYRTMRIMDRDYIDKFTVRGQYGAGEINEEKVPAYRNEENVASNSGTSTFFAGKFYIDNWRWAGVPFYLRSGKRLKKRITEISIHFKQPPLKLFSTVCEVKEPNFLVLGIQPHEKISLHLGVKHPGIGKQLYPVNMGFDYERDFDISVHFPLPYERLLIDCIKGDQTLFARQDGIEAMWAVVDPIIKRWEESPADDFPNYASGSWGPEKADELLMRDGRQWRIW